jgi:hypothetical protein
LTGESTAAAFLAALERLIAIEEAGWGEETTVEIKN